MQDVINHNTGIVLIKIVIILLLRGHIIVIDSRHITARLSF